MGRMKDIAIDIEIANQAGRTMFLLLCNGKPLALYDHRDTADYEMHICMQGDAHEGQENKYRIKTMGVVAHALQENGYV
jgi:hypothetical protein